MASRNPGPILTSTSQGSLQLIPPEFRAKIGTTVRVQKDPKEQTLSIITSVLIESKIEQEVTGEVRKTDTEISDPSSTTLITHIRTQLGQNATVTRSLVAEGTTISIGSTTIDVTQNNLGNGLVDQSITTVGGVFGNTVLAKERSRVIPRKFSAAIQETTTEQTIAGTVSMPTLGAGEITSSQEQITEQTKRTKVTSRSTGDTTTLVGKRNYVLRTAGTVTETHTDTIQSAQIGLLISESTVDPVGDGGSVLTTVSVDSHPELSNYEWDDELQVSVLTKEKYVDPPGSGATNTNFQIVDESKSLRVVVTPPTSTLDNYVLQCPSSRNMSIPDVLENVKVIWNKDSSVGDFDSDWQGIVVGTSGSLSGSESGNANSSAALIPEITFEYTQRWAKDVATTTYFFFMPLLGFGTAAMLARLTTICSGAVIRWPKFRPKGHLITLMGGKVSLQAQASANASSTFGPETSSRSRTQGTGTSYDINLSNRTILIPPMIHGNISFEGATSDTINLKAKAQVGWTGDNFPSANAVAIAEKDLNASVSPTSFSATTPASIPESGLYLVDSHVQPYKHGYIRCVAEVLNAADI